MPCATAHFGRLLSDNKSRQLDGAVGHALSTFAAVVGAVDDGDEARLVSASASADAAVQRLLATCAVATANRDPTAAVLHDLSTALKATASIASPAQGLSAG